MILSKNSKVVFKGPFPVPITIPTLSGFFNLIPESSTAKKAESNAVFEKSSSLRSLRGGIKLASF